LQFCTFFSPLFCGLEFQIVPALVCDGESDSNCGLIRSMNDDPVTTSGTSAFSPRTIALIGKYHSREIALSSGEKYP
jgi:hypothetical protein